MIPVFVEGAFHFNILTIFFSLSRCESVLNKFLRSIKQDPSRVSFEEMANTVTIHAQSHDNSLQVMSYLKFFFVSS